MTQARSVVKNLHQPTPTSATNVSGAGMDRVIERPQKWRMPWLIGIAVALMVAIVWWLQQQSSGQSLNVNGQQIMLGTVTQGTFEDFIPVRGRVTPAKTLYLDAIEGGRVERVLVEDGATLEEGQLIVELSNAALQLNVLSNEARVAEQLNNIRTLELNLEQNRLQHKRNIIDIEYQIKMLTRQLAREATLRQTNAVSESQYQDTADTLAWYQQRLNITKESQASDARMQEAQLVFLKTTGERLEHNLSLSQQNLESMNVRAPVAGKLSGFDVEVGQSIGRGERLGQIDTPNDYKISALIDEFYLGRVDIGQLAEYDGYQLRISKLYPQVQNGQFEVDLEFVGQQPDTVRRGQSVQLKLTLGDAAKAVLIPNGAFYQDTGGRWVFVVNADGQQAVRRPVRLGRRNNQFIEVIDGLEPGERIVISPYNNYLEMQQLNIQNAK
ncbi:HlyD family efflux transporter periplasmic adaptor subunit [Aestuariibacter halophilus]|uniref:HlyD family efflux transporter periplasmic adaptor subunit n=1 Tax=Fluctibacter halophilus TaxID=226011 RepID=A0ABS8G987_9ALTE|nr:HlyD family efflux transporter periplasmic adaptor subunit [Aestuariibacter halophilus]MCC2617029.1 HlyD family efflux transporter periplasmic adaptor subunit [Aestuariibacter halophilus]